MNQRSFLVRLCAALLLSLGLTAAATAQPAADNRDDGDHQILQAIYGTGRSHIDVTPRLRELARRDRTVRVGNDTFGADPDPGQRKTLRIHARGRDGQVRVFDYPEGGAVEGDRFTGWTGGNFGDDNFRGGWQGASAGGPPQPQPQGPAAGGGGEYTILQAVYGSAHEGVDVTQRLLELSRGDRHFRVTDALFGRRGGEPGVSKSLAIHARGPDGKITLFDYPEGSVFDGSQFAGWGRGGVEQGANRDGGSPRGDPDRRGAGRDEGEYRILQALYGTARRHVDVTGQLRELARADAQVRLSRSAFNVDPDPGRPKTLRIYARGRDDRVRLFEYSPGGVIDGSQFRGWRGGQWGGREDYRGNWNGEVRAEAAAPDLRIVGATWGSGSRKRDVTERLRTQVYNGRLETLVNVSSMGSDPAPGTRKTLWVTYVVDGRTQQARVDENGRLSIP